LRDKQVFQAVSYGAYAGIKWAVLTNGLVWHLYRVKLCDKVDYDHVFTLDLRDGLDDTERHYFYLLSRHGMTRKGLLDKVWHKLNTLSHDSLMNAVLTDDVITKIRIALNREYSGKLTQAEVRAAVETNLLQLD
jgi:predicted type IV restriction endonuclease